MYYVDFIAFLEKPEKDWEYILQKANDEPPNLESELELVFVRGLTLKKHSEPPFYWRFGGFFLIFLSFTGQP